MTNGTVSNVGGGSGAASKDEPGAIISAVASRQPDGTLMCARINVARGVTPPL